VNDINYEIHSLAARLQRGNPQHSKDLTAFKAKIEVNPDPWIRDERLGRILRIFEQNCSVEDRGVSVAIRTKVELLTPQEIKEKSEQA